MACTSESERFAGRARPISGDRWHANDGGEAQGVAEERNRLWYFAPRHNAGTFDEATSRARIVYSIARLPPPRRTSSMKTHLRIARPVTDLERSVRMYRDGLGLSEIGRFADHAGFDGVMLGRAGMDYHFEFTFCR